MPFAFVGLMCLLLPLLIVAASGNLQGLLLLWLWPIGAFCWWIALRRRVVWLDESTAALNVSWGQSLPLVYRRIPPSAWAGFSIEQELPVGLTQRGSSMAATALPLQWHLRGMTQRGKSVSLGVYGSERDAEALRKQLQQALRWFGEDFPIRVKLSHGVGRVVAPSQGWRDHAYFQKDSKAAALYEELCKAGSWRCLGGGSIYDADNPELLGRDDFDVPLLASRCRQSRPWRTLLSLEQEGWVSSHREDGTSAVAEMARMEARFGWAVPTMAKRMSA